MLDLPRLKVELRMPAHGSWLRRLHRTPQALVKNKCVLSIEPLCSYYLDRHAWTVSSAYLPRPGDDNIQVRADEKLATRQCGKITMIGCSVCAGRCGLAQTKILILSVTCVPSNTVGWIVAAFAVSKPQVFEAGALRRATTFSPSNCWLLATGTQ